MRAGEPCDLGHLRHWAIGGQGGLCECGSCTCSQGRVITGVKCKIISISAVWTTQRLMYRARTVASSIRPRLKPNSGKVLKRDSIMIDPIPDLVQEFVFVGEATLRLYRGVPFQSL